MDQSATIALPPEKKQSYMNREQKRRMMKAFRLRPKMGEARRQQILNALNPKPEPVQANFNAKPEKKGLSVLAATTNAVKKVFTRQKV